MGTIKQITDSIESVKGVKLLDVDPGEATNRTVVTFVGEPDAVVEAAVAGIKRAAELIDMRQHKGAHPRMGACDVCPLIPVTGITMEECAERFGGSPDFVYVTGDAYVDHPSFGVAIITRVLEDAGFSVAVLSQPDYKSCEDFKRFGKPRLGFLVSSGNIDSMVNHYSVNKKKRKVLL